MTKKLFLMGIAVAMISLLAGRATFAIFSDSASNDSTFSAGTVSINANRNDGDPVPGPMFYVTSEQGRTYDGRFPGINTTDVWAPGDYHSRTLNVTNDGSLAVKITQLGATVRGINDPTVLAEFLNKMLVTVVQTTNQNNPTVLFTGTLGELVNGPVEVLNQVNISPTATQDLTYTVTMDITAGNLLQGVEALVDFSVYVEQLRNN
ncbi:TasA family protein [Calderihabitans maritimus]|uniref:TasA family protein n=1 Tax=Calderihabitans maritimus TaxID=1246530 RepID=UPI000B5146F9|nr:TasA family protein [Calderihabitans maritimus]